MGLVTSSGALYYMLRIAQPVPGDYIVVSPGLAATSMLLVQRSQFWTRMVPVGLPRPPGESADMARDKMTGLAERIEREIRQFTRSAFVRRKFKPRKILVSGEAARVPSFLNALDARMDELDPSQEIALLCRNGIRSARALQMLTAAGFRKAYNVRGGINAWAERIDPSLPRY